MIYFVFVDGYRYIWRCRYRYYLNLKIGRLVEDGQCFCFLKEEKDNR